MKGWKVELWSPQPAGVTINDVDQWRLATTKLMETIVGDEISDVGFEIIEDIFFIEGNPLIDEVWVD